jgi:hypothetical protein
MVGEHKMLSLNNKNVARVGRLEVGLAVVSFGAAGF